MLDNQPFQRSKLLTKLERATPKPPNDYEDQVSAKRTRSPLRGLKNDECVEDRGSEASKTRVLERSRPPNIVKYNVSWSCGLLDWSLSSEARQQALQDPPRRSCGAPEHLKELSNTLHGADLKLSKTSECLQQASKHPRGTPRAVTEHCNQRTQRTPMIADHH